MFFTERERSDTGAVVAVSTVFLTNRECPWKCVFCDLWKNTLPETVPIGTIPAQIDYALHRLPPASQVKLYNSGSFFDKCAVPAEDRAVIAKQIAAFERVIVECHPSLINEEVLRFRDCVAGQLEVAMGLETVHPIALEQLNKRCTLEKFTRAAEFLRHHAIDLRVFVLVQPPFVPLAEASHWAQRSIDFAIECGATVCSLIPTRSGNGAMEALIVAGHFAEPSLDAVEQVAEYGVALKRTRVFTDLWDLQRFATCQSCFSTRRDRLRIMNEMQHVPEPVQCSHCGGGA